MWLARTTVDFLLQDPGLAGYFMLLHAELVNAAVSVGFTWTEEC